MEKFCRIVALIILVSFASCSSAPYTVTSGVNFPQLQLLQSAGNTFRPSAQITQAQPQQSWQPQQTQPAVQQQTSSSYWTGDGGRGKSITILAPKPSNLAADLAYLPDLVALELEDNFKSYSAMTLFNRVNNQRQYDELLSGLYDDNDKAGLDLGHLSSTDYMLIGTITRTSTGYALQLSVNSNSDKTTAATYSGPVIPLADLDNRTGVRRASLDLLQKMGVQLSERAKSELSAAAPQQTINYQNEIARGITAQRQGTVVEALSYFVRASDSGSVEAASWMNILEANIRSGNIGNDVRNDIQWRRDWIARLTEAEQFFDNFNKTQSVPYTLFYVSNEIKQGNVNYRDETVTLSVETNLHGNYILTQAAERTLRAVYDGLDATKRKDVWELGSWPRQRVTNLNPFARQGKTFSIVAELLNSRNQVIGRQTFQAGGYWEFNLPYGGRPSTSVSGDDRNTVNFTVKADDITDNLTIRIATVNNVAAQTAAQNGTLQVMAIPKADFDTYSKFTVVNGEVRRYSGDVKDGDSVEVPFYIWGEQVNSVSTDAFRNRRNINVVRTLSVPNGVTSIGDSAYASKGLVRITIPNGVTSIGNSAFANNRLTNVTIPNGVTSIGNRAFASNQLGSVSIPNSVTSIGDSAFASNWLSSVTIPNSVTSIGDNAFWNNQLGSIRIPNSVTSIGNSAFSSNRLTILAIPDSVTSIGNNAFANNQLGSIRIPNSVTSIGDNAFTGNRLGTITIPDSVTTIGEQAFTNNQLTNITIGANVSMQGNSFDNSFADHYNGNGKKVGIYELINETWVSTAEERAAAAAAVAVKATAAEQERVAAAASRRSEQRAENVKEGFYFIGRLLLLGGVIAGWVLIVKYYPTPDS